MKKYIIAFALQLITLSFLSFGIHYLVLEVFEMQPLWNQETYTLLQIYFFLLLTTLAMTLAMIASSKMTFQNIGYAFLVLLTLKIVANYLFIQPILNTEQDMTFVKYNYLIAFMLFLSFDVYIAYRLLNKKK